MKFIILSLLLFCPILEAQKPNVVLIITDDQGYGDLSCHGNPKLKTPHLDKLHSQSLRLTDYHVSPTCAPTRASLMTGHYANRTGVWHTINGLSLLRKDEITLPQILNDAGYATGMFGKWHLGDNYPFRPEDRGFNEVLRHGGGGMGQSPDYWDNAYFDSSYFHNGTPTPIKGFCTDVFFQQAKQFIQQNKQQPFFAYISTNAPHGPLHCPTEYSKPYAHLGEKTANFYGMIANIDDNVGDLTAWLEQQGLLDNTILIFTTDNGTAGGRKIFNAGMKGAKNSEFEGGHRVPFFLHWPAGKMTGGHDIPQLTAHLDILPTLAELCQAPLPPTYKGDGKSITPLLRREQTNWEDRMIMTDSQRINTPQQWKKTAVMSTRWRLINGKQLYDIKADPSQKRNLASKHPEVVSEMRAFYQSLWADMAPSYKLTPEIILGNSADNPATLTSHDHHVPGDLDHTPWNHKSVRSATGVTGYWAVDVESAGNYQINLYRWPSESGLALTAAAAPGAAVPGLPSYRSTPGKALDIRSAQLLIAGQSFSAKANPQSTHVSFIAKLPKGSTRLLATFTTATGESIGAYYAEVELLSK